MSNFLITPQDEDIRQLIVAQAHLGTKNLDFQMSNYIWKRRPDGLHVINLSKTWEKIALAARIIAAVENPADVLVVAARPWAQRAVLKFATFVGATAISGRYTPGTLTNHTQKKFVEPRVLIVNDPYTDKQPVLEASYVNVPTIAFCDSESSLKLIDVAIPCNNRAKNAIGLMWWLLAREVLRIRGTISRSKPWDVMVDLFIYRDADEIEKQTAEAAQAQAAAANWDNTVATEWNNTPAQEWEGTQGVNQEWGGAGAEWNGMQGNGSWDASTAPTQF